jgi:uncharacterized protein (DUF1800 family)
MSKQGLPGGSEPGSVYRSRSARRLALGIVSLALATLPAVAGVRPGGGGFGGGTKPPAAVDEALMFHVLSRVTYGADEASLAEIRALGVDEFLHRQLEPALIDDSALETRLSREMPPPSDPLYQFKHFRYGYLVRAAESKRQLQEIMTQFWENHFDTVVPFGNTDEEIHMWTTMEEREDNGFRLNALGRFRDLLEISAKSRAMMYFLDNYTNNVARGNENYARELLELHTLSVDCGYDQTDVQEVARIWTGWTGADLPGSPRPGDTDPRIVREDTDGDTIVDFIFNGRAHDFTSKFTLGTSFPAGQGIAEGERVLDILSRHPCTARFIATKLIELFATDAPTDAFVDRIANTFLESDGNIRRVLEEIFWASEFRDPASFGGKVRTPLEQTMSAIRGTEATIQLGTDTGRPYDYQETYFRIYVMGQQLFDYAIPTGYPERAQKWISANGFLQRWKFADALMFYRPAPDRQTYTDPFAIVTRLRLTDADEVIDHFTRMLTGVSAESTRRTQLRAVLVDPVSGLFVPDPSNGAQDNRLREMVSQVLGFPELNQQ